MKILIAFIVSCTLVPAACFAVGLDNWAGASRNFFFEVCFIALGLAMGALVLWLGRHKVLLCLPAVYVLFMLALPLMDFSPVKPAVRAVHEIRPGMSESQVREVLASHFPEHGRFKRPTFGTLQENVLCFALDPHDGRYNAAVVRISFSGGKCVSAEFLAD